MVKAPNNPDAPPTTHTTVPPSSRGARYVAPLLAFVLPAACYQRLQPLPADYAHLAVRLCGVTERCAPSCQRNRLATAAVLAAALGCAAMKTVEVGVWVGVRGVGTTPPAWAETCVAREEESRLGTTTRSRCRRDAVAVSLRRCHGVAATLSRCRRDAVTVSPRRCHGVAATLQRCRRDGRRPRWERACAGVVAHHPQLGSESRR